MKKMYIHKSILILSILFSLSLVAQEKLLQKADKEYDKLSYIDARKIYIDVVNKGYTSQDIYQKIGDSYYFNAQLADASVWYEKLCNEYNESLDPEYLFRYSQTLKNLRNYDKADKVMVAFDKATGKSESRVKLFKKERNYLELIELQSGKFDIVNLPINSSRSDFGPSFYKDDQIMFASSRSNGGSRIVHEWNEAPFLDLYRTFREGKQSIAVEGIEELKGNINTKLHESSTVTTKDGKTMYFTRNNYTNKRRKADANGTTKLKLYKASLVNNKWTDIKELPFNSDEYSVAHPALSVNEKKLYFASDMPGSKGMSDLFVVDITGKDSYSEPKNLGSKINTEGRETFPFISKSGKLYFASDGHIGLGGLDVFISEPNETKRGFSDPFNVGKPINSSDDDFTFIIDEATKIGFFTSNRYGGVGDDDIYSFVQTEDLISSCNQYLSGIVTDAETRALLPNAKVVLFDANMDKIASTTADSDAKYSLPIDCDRKYVIRASKEAYEFTEVNFASTEAFEFKHNQPIQLRKGTAQLGVVTAKVGDDLAKLLQLNPIYFDFDKSFIRPDAEIELQKVISVMKEYPEMNIDVRSHTDSRAPFDYNMRLSTRRNKSTIKYIIDKGGISPARLTGRGYGETNLTNNCADGVECSEAQHQLNRRSEFIILKQ
ncbi:OmpA family protein [Aquimarina agarivorans]|uniref:OmpA family protein n=1 Tax=Aquimarina agarivorans TaxID=980584 RepID=UPI000248FAA8|nr:OmpA family protein [Aquimarina agarivorans]